MKVVNITDLRQNLQDIIDSVYYTKKPVIVGKRGKPRVIVTPIPENNTNLNNVINDFEESNA